MADDVPKYREAALPEAYPCMVSIDVPDARGVGRLFTIHLEPRERADADWASPPSTVAPGGPAEKS